MLKVIRKIKTAIFATPLQNEISFMPKERRYNWIPKAKFKRTVTKDGQIKIPKEEREFDDRDDITPGDIFEVDVFAPQYDNSQNRRQYASFNATVTKNNNITIPKEKREEYDIRHNDIVAVHLYWSTRNFDKDE